MKTHRTYIHTSYTYSSPFFIFNIVQFLSLGFWSCRIFRCGWLFFFFFLDRLRPFSLCTFYLYTHTRTFIITFICTDYLEPGDHSRSLIYSKTPELLRPVAFSLAVLVLLLAVLREGTFFLSSCVDFAFLCGCCRCFGPVLLAGAFSLFLLTLSRSSSSDSVSFVICSPNVLLCVQEG